MLTRADVKRAAEYSYSRGMELYNQDKVTSIAVETENGLDIIDARVKGSGRKYYEISIALDRESGGITESYCECPAFYSYPGLCKHCVAALLEYISSSKRQMAIEDYVNSLRHRKPDGRESLPAVQKQTTAAMKELLLRQNIRQSLPILRSDTFGKVHIAPILTCGARECQVEFRIGVQKMYVMKDVFTFAQAMLGGLEYSYGKKLEFVHSTEMFDSQSGPMAAFITDWVRRNERRFIQGGYQGYPRPKLRNMPLDGGDLEEFLDAAGEAPFLANAGGNGEQEWRLAPDGLRRQIRINGTPDGIEVSMDSLFGYECTRNFVYFREGFIYRVPKKDLDPVRDFMTCIRALPGGKAFIGREDIPAFIRNLLPSLKKCCDCTIEDFREEDYGIVDAVFRFYLDMPQKDFITCRVTASYGERDYNIYDSFTDLDRRDVWKEKEAERIVSAFCNAFDEKEQIMVAGGDEERMYALLTEGIERLRGLGEVFISDALKRIRILPTPRVSVGVSLSGDLLTLEMTSEDMPKEQLIEILSRYDRRKKYFRLKNGAFIHMEEDSLAPLQEIRQGLCLTERQMKRGAVEAPRCRVLFLDDALRESENITIRTDENYRTLLRSMKGAEDNAYEVPDSLKDIMREYQKYGYRWLRTLYQNGFGGILADDMGLGKTLQVICFLLSIMNKETDMENAGFDSRIQQSTNAAACCLIVCPASLVYNWKNELDRFAPSLKARTAVGTAADREEVLKDLSGSQVLITSYELLRRDLERYQEIQFFCQVIDEAQYIKNHGTQAAKAVKAVRAGFKLALTGTPVENRLSELWSIFDFVMPGYLYSYQRFREELELPVVQKDDADAADRLQKMIRPFVLRRLKRDVLEELPDKLEENLYVRLSGEQRELYDAHVKRMQLMLDKESDEQSSGMQLLAELTRLRQICCDPALLFQNYGGDSAKKEMVLNLIHNAVENGHKVLLFSQFTTMLDRLTQAMMEENIACHLLTGSTSKEKRAEMVEAFAVDDIPVFCISLKAGGTGLNLTAADVVIHFDPWWNVAVQNQATDRAHRIGQNNAVNVYRLIAKDTIEEKIIGLQERKQELSDRILGGGSLGTGGLTREELMELLR